MKPTRVVILGAVPAICLLAGCLKQQTIEGSPTAREVDSPTTESSDRHNPASSPVVAATASPVSGPEVKNVPVQPATGRIWTSTDGRTVAAELISRTSDSITIRRNEDLKEFSIPLNKLTAEDQAHVRASGIPITVIKQFDVSRLNELKRTIPTLTAVAPLESSYSTLVDHYNKYKRRIEFISETGYERHLQMLRHEVESDLKRLQPIASTSLRDAPTFNSSTYSWSSGSGAWKDAWAARSIIAWLQGPLNRHIDELERLK